MPNPLVTAIIPVFNRAWCIRRSVESVLAQTYRPLELIVVDDGSTDSTWDILKIIDSNHRGLMFERGLSSAADPICLTLFRQENRGVSAARNAAIGIARGEFIALLDSDDEWLPEKTARQVSHLLNHPALLLNQTDEIWIRRGKRVNQNKRHWKEEGDLFEKSLDVCAISPSAVMMHRHVFDMVGLFDESFIACEDYDLWLRIACRYPVGLLPEYLTVKHGGHEDQLSATAGSLDLYRIRSIMNLLDANLLTASQRAMAIQSLLEKCRIYAQGCQKRGKNEEAREVEKLPGRYTR